MGVLIQRTLFICERNKSGTVNPQDNERRFILGLPTRKRLVGCKRSSRDSKMVHRITVRKRRQNWLLWDSDVMTIPWSVLDRKRFERFLSLSTTNKVETTDKCKTLEIMITYKRIKPLYINNPYPLFVTTTTTKRVGREDCGLHTLKRGVWFIRYEVFCGWSTGY